MRGAGVFSWRTTSICLPRRKVICVFTVFSQKRGYVFIFLVYNIN